MREPRSIANCPAICASFRDGCSCRMELGSQTFHAVSVTPSQNSSRPS